MPMNVFWKKKTMQVEDTFHQYAEVLFKNI